MTDTEFELLKVCVYQGSAITSLRTMVDHLFRHITDGAPVDREKFTEFLTAYVESREKANETVEKLMHLAESDVKNA